MWGTVFAQASNFSQSPASPVQNRSETPFGAHRAPLVVIALSQISVSVAKRWFEAICSGGRWQW